MTEQIRWGILGTGRIARKFCDTLKELEQAQIWAVGSRTSEKAEEFGTAYGIERCYGSYRELVSDKDVDIIYVATPIACHYENVKLCLNAGKHVLCEKAFTQTATEAEELYRLAQEKHLFLMEALWSKCQPVFRKLMEWKEQGRFGEIQAVEAKFYTCATTEHRLMRDRTQGGTLYDLTIYPMTYACALLGYEPEHIHALAVKGGDDVDVMESIQFSYANGSFASLTGGLSCEKQASLYIHGTKARVLINREFFFQAQEAVLLDWQNQPLEEFAQPFAINGYEYEAQEAMACVSQGRLTSSLVPMEDTIRVIRLLEECRRQWR